MRQTLLPNHLLQLGQNIVGKRSCLLDMLVGFLAPRPLDVREQFVGLRDAQFDHGFGCVPRIADDCLCFPEILARSGGDR